ncbi:MAG: Eco57I restriction-modification methylase domain-containing protein [Holophagaceae bacterium]|nr:Eco57I restriction-modification methylase domain-containing protein [Holophagaceae bacterium]
MRFDVVVGNPPYQEESLDTSDTPIYHFFMDAAYEIAEKVCLITPARFLFSAGKTPEAWNQKMLADEHLKVIFFEQDTNSIFPNTVIKGGVAITYRDTKIKYGAIGQFAPYPELNTIIQKVKQLNENSIETAIFLQNKLNLAELYSDHPAQKTVIGSDGREKRLTTSIFETLCTVFTKEKKADTDLAIIGLQNNRRAKFFIPQKFIEQTDSLGKYKVLVPKANGSGAIGEVIPTQLIGEPLIGEPQTGFTQSFIAIGAFDLLSEAEAVSKYVKSKFARTMLGVLKVTQDNPPEKWRYVPLQDFTPQSDIDWTKTISEIDEQLYAKYGLDENEIAFIEEKITAME